MRRVVRSRADGPCRPRRTVAALSALAACCFLSAAPSAASAPPDPAATPSGSPEPAASAAAVAPAAGTGQPPPGTGSSGDAERAQGATAAADTGADVSAPSRQLGESADLAVSGTVRPTAAADREGPESRENPVVAAVETFDYVVTATNRGPSTARQVRVTDRLPLSLEFVSSRDGCTAGAGTVVCGPLATLAVGASHAWVITVRLAAGYRGDGTDIVNEAVVDSATSDPDSRNNTSSLTGLEIPPSARTADLSLRKTALLAKGREHVRPGDKFTYLITVRNEGPATARQVRVTDLLPSSLALLSSPDDCAVAKDGDRLVTCPLLDRLAAGETAEYRITVRAVAGDRAARPPAGRCTPIENIARVTTASFDPDLSDNANRPGTTGPGGGRLCLVDEGRESRPDGHGGREDGHHGRDDHHGSHPDGREQHGGHGNLADSGTTVPAWLLWTSTGLVACGAALRAAFRVRRP